MSCDNDLEIVKAIPQQPQAQFDTLRQLQITLVAANRLGLYDASDVISSLIRRSPSLRHIPTPRTGSR